jgi:hypothetical protein
MCVISVRDSAVVFLAVSMVGSLQLQVWLHIRVHVTHLTPHPQ